MNRKDVFSRVFRAGRRTYFFDVKETRAGDYYLTITESKKHYNHDEQPYYRKHKIYLYKEDFNDFKEALKETMKFIIDNKGTEIISNAGKSIENQNEENPLESSDENLDQLDDENFQFGEE
ncbi:MAG: DUF3276 family protein [Flavobacteriaceae bacterium]|nr:DUF3276 family protein [Flavobacteriaceae bacterium]MCY4266746.1 DUF3276 family protein [Flavobacteriaceae bacterium]